MVVFFHRRASWPQTSIEKVLFDVEYSRVLVFQGGVIERSSRMTGNCQVRFLEGWPPAMGAGYSAEFLRSGLKPWHFVHEPSPSSRGSSAGARTPRRRMVCSWLRPWPWLRLRCSVLSSRARACRRNHQVPRVPLPDVGVTFIRETCTASSEDITPRSSLVRTHAPIPCGSPRLRLLASFVESSQVATSPCCYRDSPDVISANPSPDARAHTPAVC
jgi:hypothetical protein